MGELGLAFIKLTKFETDEATFDTQRTRAADMKKLATAAVKASRLYRELNAQTVKHLVRKFSPIMWLYLLIMRLSVWFIHFLLFAWLFISTPKF